MNMAKKVLSEIFSDITLTNIETQSWQVVVVLALFLPVTPPIWKSVHKQHEEDMTCASEMSVWFIAYDIYKCERISTL